MTGHGQSAIEKYLELAGLSERDLKEVATPCIDDHQLSEEDFATKGRLSPIAGLVLCST